MTLSEKIQELITEGMKAGNICKKLKITRNQYNNAKRKGKSPINPTDKRVMELEARLGQERREKHDALKKVAAYEKKENSFSAIMEEVEDIIKPLTPLPSAIKLKRDVKHVEHAVLHLSDEHMDEVILPEQVNNLEDYNFPIALKRAETLVDTTLNITQSTLTNYKFTDLWILAYGDHTNGTIHEGVSRSYFKNQFKNCFAIGQCHALMFRDLAPHFENVHVLYIPGNHGKPGAKKDYNSPLDSWDYMVGETARMLCKDIKNVSFMIPNAYAVTLEIAGYNFAIEHGDDIKSWNSIPFYGLERKSRRLIALNATQGKKIDYFVYGHFHQPTMSSGLGNSEILINGAWKATDPYIYSSFSGYVEPSQLLHGVHPEHGITWRYKVKLRSKDEKKGPDRYIIDI